MEFKTEYDSQEVIDNAYRHSYQILMSLTKLMTTEKVDIHDIILNVKNLTYYLEDYAFWKASDTEPDTKEGKEGLTPTSGVEGDAK